MNQQAVDAPEIFSSSSSKQEQEVNPIFLLKNPSKFTAHFNDTAHQFFVLINQDDLDEALLCLIKMQDLLEVAMSQVQLGKEILLSISQYWKLCIYINLASIYQKESRIDRCHKHCLKADLQIQQLLKRAQNEATHLNLAKFRIRLKFQHCAVLSQLGQHNQALDVCRSTFKLMECYLSDILTFIKSQPDHQDADKLTAESIVFQNHVKTFAEDVITSLVDFLKKPISQLEIRSPFYYWVRNPEKNEQQVTKMFMSPKPNGEWKKSILGVPKGNQKIAEFNIGSIMHIGKCFIKELDHPRPLAEYLFKEQVYEMVIFTSLAYFTLATQLRFIETNKKSVAPSNLINRRYGYEDKSDAYRLSEMYHLRSIDVVAKSIQFPIPFLTHIIRSYEKHYIINKPLEKIVAIPDQSMLSVTLKPQKDNHEKPQVGEEEDIYLFKIPRSMRKKQKLVNTLCTKMGLKQQNNNSQEFMQGKESSSLRITAPTIRQSQKPENKRRNKSLGRNKPKKSLKAPASNKIAKLEGRETAVYQSLKKRKA